MSTIFNDISKKIEVIPEETTKFVSYLNQFKELENAGSKPTDFDFVDFLGNDGDYGDTFKAYNIKDPKHFIIFFGIKGLEFNK